jgi:hypothetical protein
MGAALLLATALGLASAAPLRAQAVPAAPAAGEDKATVDLRAFCKKWMGFLEQRESDNRRKVKWQPGGAGVAGTFVGYSKDYDCIMKEKSTNGTPIATIVYREYLYSAAGPSKDEALAAQPTVVEATEVTEIFRYTKGEWVY